MIVKYKFKDECITPAITELKDGDYITIPNYLYGHLFKVYNPKITSYNTLKWHIYKDTGYQEASISNIQTLSPFEAKRLIEEEGYYVI